jgi:hypothetical protein
VVALGADEFQFCAANAAARRVHPNGLLHFDPPNASCFSHSHLVSRKISFGDKGSFYRFYRCLKLDEPRHCRFIRAALVRFGQKLGAQPTLFDHSGERLYQFFFC